jgi:hypothetical protein
VPVAAGFALVDVVTVVGGADTAAELGATVGVWAVSAELGWALLAEFAGPLEAGPQPDSSTIAASSPVIGVMPFFMLCLLGPSVHFPVIPQLVDMLAANAAPIRMDTPIAKIDITTAAIASPLLLALAIPTPPKTRPKTARKSPNKLTTGTQESKRAMSPRTKPATASPLCPVDTLCGALQDTG